jgi:phosphoribosylformimino-5-aminoimidazole carboxamide ribotide isomerase
MKIIPAIDIIEGKCVRLTQGDYSQKIIYNEDPLEVAMKFEDSGIQRLHLVDLDGARSGKVVNYKVLEKISMRTKLVIDFGGGIKTDESINMVFESGATIASIGSVAVKNKELFCSWIEKYGAAKILLGADVKNEKISIHGWLETTSISVFDFMKEYLALGITTVFCTDISKDGLLEGPSLELYKRMIAEFSTLKLIASGGVSSIKDLEQLKEAGCSGIIIGKAIYEGRIKMNELKLFL